MKIDTTVIKAGFIAFIIGAGIDMSSATFLLSIQNYAHYKVRGIYTASIIFSRILG
ncbi:hypothetical protein [Pantoea sp. Mhis]|uniref:hypothetical protein n=1 Tax=Pantoea sp. Mhis TaxID=2576759 RepID=UPI001357DDC4|nr:hypothetical protein [Pantoea sp. Mhis]